ncbi:aconitate hydratase [Frankia sp. BMG5.11]|uniref:aconitate hydratase n=1 Tax=Parafrankia sp. BMG5.11 TaxID=222540 RepID=UPI001040059C|nr:aconitate hydratase [Parafrankia sp. BMG5.11]
MGRSVARKLIDEHLVTGRPVVGEEITLRIDQTLTQDATGTLVMLELEAMGLRRAQTECSVQYVDHNLLQTDNRNPDDHLFLLSAAQRFGLWFSRPGNGISHPVHMRYFGRPGATMVGSDSHTCAAGSLGMLAIGVGGLEVATAVAGHPLPLRMPEIWGVRLVGELPEWVSAKDVILEMLRRHGVKGAINRIVEYYGPGVATLSAMDRHVIANMGAELGATTSVFPSDDEVRRFLRGAGREEAFTELAADPDTSYDVDDEIDLSTLEPLIARPSSPGNVVPVREVVGEPVHQVVVGSSANPGLRDVAVVAAAVAGRTVHPQVSLDVNPTSPEILVDLANLDLLAPLLTAGARLHQAGCLGCIGMGQAPATGRNSLRTFPRNFPGRSGTPDDRVWLCSPETAVAAALTGEITDPRTLPGRLGVDHPALRLPESSTRGEWLLVPPLPETDAARVELVRGPNIAPLPESTPLADRLRLPVLLKVGDDVSTDEIMPAGNRVLPFRSNIAKMADFAFADLDPGYSRRAREAGHGHGHGHSDGKSGRCDDGPSGEDEGPAGHAIVAGNNYGQGSSREHAALVPHYLGLRLVVAKSFARIHWQNLANFGVLAVEFADHADYDRVGLGDVVALNDVAEALRTGSLWLDNETKNERYQLTHHLSARQQQLLAAGGLLPRLSQQRAVQQG